MGSLPCVVWACPYWWNLSGVDRRGFLNLRGQAPCDGWIADGLRNGGRRPMRARGSGV